MDKKYSVDIDLYKEDYGVVKTLDCVGKFDAFDDAMSFAEEYAKDKSHFKKKWLKECNEIQLTIRHNIEFDEDGEAVDWEDEDVVVVDM